MTMALFAGVMAACNAWANPVAQFYSGTEGYPAWTDRIAWHQRIDMSAYSQGANDFEKFENARDELAARGGGVLYYPRGTYDFSDAPADGPNGRGMMLRSGVIVMGEKPTVDSDATDGTLLLPTIFDFGFQTKGGGPVPRDWSIIGLMPEPGEGVRDVDDVGLLWVHVIGAAVWFGCDMDWADSWAISTSSNGWYRKSEVDKWKQNLRLKNGWDSRVPDGTHPNDMLAGVSFPESGRIRLATHFRGSGDGRILMGCIFEDGVVFNDYVDLGCGTQSFYPMFWSARVAVYGSRVFIAGNVLPKSTRCFTYSQKTRSTNNGQRIGGCESSTILFDYNKTCGIDVNKELLGQEGNQSPGSDPTMSADSGLFKQGVAVIDNWVYNHGHKGYCLSGMHMTVRNNRNQRDYLKEGDDVYGLGSGWELTLDGTYQSSPGGPGHYSDNLSRAFDISGMNVWVHGNWMNNTGSDPGNDGEAILIQEWGGTPVYSWAITRNTHVKGEGEGGYIGGYDVNQYGSLMAWNSTPGFVGNVKAGKNIDCAFVSNTAGGGEKSTGTDALLSCPDGQPNAPTDLSAISRDDHVFITWNDASDTEIGFRIDRSIDQGQWYAIAYRPRRSAGSPHNRQEWADFLAPPKKALTYRVVAIGCDDSDQGASTMKSTVSLTPTTSIAPKRSSTTLQAQAVTHGEQLQVFDLRGRRINLVSKNKQGFGNGMFIVREAKPNGVSTRALLR